MHYELSYLQRPDGVTLAYATSGSGPPLLLVQGWTTHLEWFFIEPNDLLFAPLTDHFTLITYDKHGFGLSDRDRTDFSLDSELADLYAVVDHLDLGSFALMGMSEGGPVAVRYSAENPENVERLALYSTFANGPSVAPMAVQESLVSLVRASWGMGSQVVVDLLVPDASKEQREEIVAYARASCSADAAADTLAALYTWDVRPLLPHVRAPTIVIHRRDSRAFQPRHGRDIAAGISDCRAVIIDGVTHFPPTPGDPHNIEVVNELLGFLAHGARATPVRDRATAFRTILFTDVEASTDLVGRLGDDESRAVLKRHEEVIRRSLRTHGGTELKTMGDGFMVSFDSASAALDAAIDMQRSLDASSDAIAIRIGIHAGEPIAEETDLHGTAVIQAARIMGAANGGQILTSGLVRELVAGRSYRWSQRGRQRLKGFGEPVLLHELHWTDEVRGGAAALAARLAETIGAEPSVGDWLEVTQQRIDDFANVTLDHQFIHVDPLRAEKTSFGATIAHGFLLLSLLSALVETVPGAVRDVDEVVMAINYGFDRVRFVSPVRAGSRIRASVSTKSVELRGTAVQVTNEVTVEIDGGDEPAVVAEWIGRLVVDS